MKHPTTQLRLAFSVAATALCVAAASAAMAATIVSVAQNGRSFAVKQVDIRSGDTIRFLNADSFIHHVYVRADRMKFDSAEQEPGASIDVLFPAAGSYSVRCEIHPKMLLQVDVH